MPHRKPLPITAVLVAAFAGPASAQSAFTLTILHNNDGESDVLPNAADASLNPGGGDAARFATLVNQRRAASTSDGLLTLTSGDNFLAGPEFTASTNAFPDGSDFFDARVVRGVGYDALTLGNHDFDFGPSTLADFIRASQPTFGNPIPFLSANLDFSAEPELQGLFDDGLIARSATFDFNGQQVGVVGGTTPNLPFISSPGQTRVLDPLSTIQAEVDRLTNAGVNKIVLSSHLQGVQEDINLLEQLRNVDAAIAGGGDELLDPFPLRATDAAGREVPVVTTPGGFEFLGELNLAFDAEGELLSSGGQVFAVDASIEPDATVQAAAVDPVAAGVAALAANVIGTSEIELDVRRDAVRSRQTDAGSLIADSQLDAAERLAEDFGVTLDDPLVSLANGGGIRTDAVVPAGDITELDTFDALPFGNFVTIVEDVQAADLKLLLENAVSRIELDADGEPVATGGGTGRFAQVGGLSFTYDPSADPAELEGSGADLELVFEGARIVDLFLDDGTQLVFNGELLDPDFEVDIVTNSFSAAGGDQYPFPTGRATLLGETGQQALAFYIENTLGGRVSAAALGAAGSRISVVPTPTAVAAGAVLGLAVLGRRRRS